MRAFDLLLQLRGLFAARSRVALTLLGIVIGSGSIVLLASLVRGGEEALVQSNQDVTDGDLVTVRATEVPPGDRERTRRELSRTDADAVRSSPLFGGAAAQTEASRSTHAYAAKRKKDVTLVTGEPGTLAIYKLALEAGRAIDEADQERRGRVCVLGREVAAELFDGASSAVGQHVTIEGEVWTVIGALQDKPMLGATDDTNIWNRKVIVPSSTWDAVLTGTHSVDRLILRPSRARPAPQSGFMRAFLRTTLLRRHLGVENFKLDDPANGGQEQLILSIIELLLLSTGGLAMVASGINIMNVMLVTVTERTREIGVRRALGAKRGDILAQFLLESAALATLGGVVGVALGLGAARGAAALAEMALGKFSFVVEGWSIALGIGLSLVTGIAFGIFPAWRASRTSPIEALRAE